VTQQNASMVEESTAASHSMSQESEQLASLISQFQVGRRSASGDAGRARPNGPTANRAAGERRAFG
jgi:methyl-accepting chemotaxis protein